jgi:hypothetical protein
MDALNARADADMRLKSRDLLLREFTAGIWTREEYRAKLDEETDVQNKRARYSPEWGEIEEGDF